MSCMVPAPWKTTAQSPDATFLLLQCSVPCGVGQRTRDVKCVSNLGDVVDDEECNMKLRPNDIENCDMGPCAKSWFLTEWSDRVRLPNIFILPNLLKQEHQNLKILICTAIKGVILFSMFILGLLNRQKQTKK